MCYAADLSAAVGTHSSKEMAGGGGVLHTLERVMARGEKRNGKPTTRRETSQTVELSTSANRHHLHQNVPCPKARVLEPDSRPTTVPRAKGNSQGLGASRRAATIHQTRSFLLPAMATKHVTLHPTECYIGKGGSKIDLTSISRRDGRVEAPFRTTK